MTVPLADISFGEGLLFIFDKGALSAEEFDRAKSKLLA
jgi:hypothetical protein